MSPGFENPGGWRWPRCGRADAGLQHAAAPDGHAGVAGGVVDAHGLAVPAHAPDLDVDDAAGAELDRRLRVRFRADRLVEADRGLQRLRELRVRDEVLVVERLLHVVEPERVERAQRVRVRQRVRRIRVHRERDVGKSVAHRGETLRVAAGLDLELDPPVALRDVLAHVLDGVGGRGRDPERDADLDGVARAAERLPERDARGPRKQIPQRALHGGLRHPVPPHARARGRRTPAARRRPSRGRAAGGNPRASAPPSRASRASRTAPLRPRTLPTRTGLRRAARGGGTS